MVKETKQVNKFDLKGKKTGAIDVPPALTNTNISDQTLKEYIVAIRENLRQWSANTKTRSEVSHTTKKVHAQKGTGNARHSSTVAPQYRGGGIVFGPKPKFDQHKRINKKERRAAIRSLIATKIENNQLSVLESTEMEKPKTQVISKFLEKTKNQGRVLFLAEASPEKSTHTNFKKSLNNIPKVDFLLATNVNGYDLMRTHNLIVTEKALEELNNWLTKEGE